MKAKIDSRKRIANAGKKYAAGDFVHALQEVEEVLRLDETNADALKLRDQIVGEQRRREAESALALVEQAERETDLTRRVDLLRQAATHRPDDARLQLTLSLAENKRDVIGAIRARAKYLEHKRDFDGAAAQLRSLSPFVADQGVIARELQALENRKSQPAAAPLTTTTPAPTPAAVQAAPAPPPVIKPEPVKTAAAAAAAAAAPAPAKTPSKAPAEPNPQPGTVAPRPVVAPQPGVAAQPAQRSRILPIAGALAAILVIAIGGIWWKTRQSGPSGVSIAVQVQPADSTIEVNGTTHDAGSLKLEPGQYNVRITRPGYGPVEQSLSVPGGTIQATLQPLKSEVKLDTNLSGADFVFDDQPARKVDGGQIILSDVEPGSHTVKVRDQKTGESVIAFETAVGTQPKVTGITPGKDVVAFAVSSLDKQSRIDTKIPNLPVRKEDGSVVGQTSNEPLNFTIPTAGGTTLIVGQGEEEWRIESSNQPKPVLTLFLGVRAAATGGFFIHVNQDGVSVRLDNKLLPHLKLRNGERRAIRDIPFGKHEIKVELAGYRANPPFRRVDIEKGKDASVEFTLTPGLAIEVQKGVYGARILVNGVDRGGVAQDGTAAVTAEVSGPCKIELKRSDYTSVPVERECKPGEKIVVTAADAHMVPNFGYAGLTVKPADAKITAQKGSEAEREVTPSQGLIRLPLGKYTIKAAAKGYKQRVQQDVNITPDKVNSLGAWELAPER